MIDPADAAIMKGYYEGSEKPSFELARSRLSADDLLERIEARIRHEADGDSKEADGGPFAKWINDETHYARQILDMDDYTVTRQKILKAVVDRAVLLFGSWNYATEPPFLPGDPYGIYRDQRKLRCCVWTSLAPGSGRWASPVIAYEKDA